LKFDLKPKQNGDVENVVLPGKYSGTIRLLPLGAPADEVLEVPVELLLGP
jgi:hypothetical protein